MIRLILTYCLWLDPRTSLHIYRKLSHTIIHPSKFKYSTTSIILDFPAMSCIIVQSESFILWVTHYYWLKNSTHTVCVYVCVNKVTVTATSSHVHLLQWKRDQCFWERLARLEEHVISSWPSTSSRFPPWFPCAEGLVLECSNGHGGTHALTTLWIKTQNSTSLGSCHCRDSHITL